jgi:RNA polymerase sigma factor (sigma-70 family)
METDGDVAQLVAAAARGDQGAWNAIVDRYLSLVYSVTRAYRLSPGDAEDVNQTVWLRLVEHLDDIREPRALPKWIMTTAKHECLRLIKAGYRERPVDPLSDKVLEGTDEADLDSELLRAEWHQALRDGLAELTPAHRRLLLLLVADPPLSYREISVLLGIPIGSIGPTRARILERLRHTAALRRYSGVEPPAEDMGGSRDEHERVAQRR